MNTSSDNNIEKPKIIAALTAGFNTIASKPFLMFFPILLDLFLWFGPAWRIDGFFKPFIDNLTALPGMDGSGEYAQILESYQTFWEELTTNLNLAISLRTLPIGVPSLMVSKPSFLNPLGQSPIISLETEFQVLGALVLFLLTGYMMGSMYLKNISKQIIPTSQDSDLLSFLKVLLQVMLMPLILLIILILLSIPILFILGFAMMINPAISQFMTFIIAVILLWVLMPLVFTPHCIFMYKQNLIAAMMTSINVVRASMGKTAWFLIISLILFEGMNQLWQTPAVDNWFLLIGILGHAFIVTAVIASSFHYFLDATRFTQSVMNQSIKTA